jgi:hypothetical protein
VASGRPRAVIARLEEVCTASGLTAPFHHACRAIVVTSHRDKSPRNWVPQKCLHSALLGIIRLPYGAIRPEGTNRLRTKSCYRKYKGALRLWNLVPQFYKSLQKKRLTTKTRKRVTLWYQPCGTIALTLVFRERRSRVSFLAVSKRHLGTGPRPPGAERTGTASLAAPARPAREAPRAGSPSRPRR